MKKCIVSISAAVAAFLTGCQNVDSAIKQAQELVQKNQASCVLIKDNRIIAQESGRGLAPLLTVLEKYPEEMNGGIIVDKVIGKAAASIIVVGKAKAVYTELISEPGVVMLEKHNVNVQYQKCVPQILNRKRDGLCPMEKLVQNIDDPHQSYFLFSGKRK